MNLCEFDASQVYKVSFRIARAVSKKKNVFYVHTKVWIFLLPNKWLFSDNYSVCLRQLLFCSLDWPRIWNLPALAY